MRAALRRAARVLTSTQAGLISNTSSCSSSPWPLTGQTASCSSTGGSAGMLGGRHSTAAHVSNCASSSHRGSLDCRIAAAPGAARPAQPAGAEFWQGGGPRRALLAAAATAAVPKWQLMGALADQELCSGHDLRPPFAGQDKLLHLLARVADDMLAWPPLKSPPALPPLPVPNLGYACQNLALRRLPRLDAAITNRSCRRHTVESRGLGYVAELAVLNCMDLVKVLMWNAENGVRFYRVSSGLLPWVVGGGYQLEDLPLYEVIAGLLRMAGHLAVCTGQRLTAHPPHYVKLASKDEHLLGRSLQVLELQSKVLDLMFPGFPPSHWNKINIHVGGSYGSKPAALRRFAAAFGRLAPGAAARLTVENDDRPNSYSVADLLPLSHDTGIPITFDAHHHRCCSGGLAREEALAAALATWPAGVRPVVHWSEPPECPRRRRIHPHAHSAFVYGPISLHGREAEVDIMIESKAAEQALLLYRDRIQPLEREGLASMGDAKWEQPLVHSRQSAGTVARVEAPAAARRAA